MKHMDQLDNVEHIVHSVENEYQRCLNVYVSSSSSSSSPLSSGTNHDLLTFMEECTKEERIQTEKAMEKMRQEVYGDVIKNKLTSDWITCPSNEPTDTSYAKEQTSPFFENWIASYHEYRSVYIGEGMSEYDANVKARMNANGSSDRCVVNTVGGAIYWFTIMTTIGYGNTSVVTTEGRFLVFFLGFISILSFFTVVGNAGYIMLTIANDFFHRVRVKKLTKGFAAALFWLVVLLLWLCVVSGIYQHLVHNNYNQFEEIEEFTWLDAYWFAFISLTTVGFGDYYIPHDTARVSDMFITPLLILIGFVFMANFILKFSEFVIDIFILSSLQNQLKKEKKDNTQSLSGERNEILNTLGTAKVYDLSGQNVFDVPEVIITPNKKHNIFDLPNQGDAPSFELSDRSNDGDSYDCNNCCAPNNIDHC